MRTRQELSDRLRAEFLEMPGLRLKAEQVQRLCGIERTICGLLLDSLVEANFLCVAPDGHYARVTDGSVARPRPAPADINRRDSDQQGVMSRPDNEPEGKNLATGGNHRRDLQRQVPRQGP
jgi:hypothetical protein